MFPKPRPAMPGGVLRFSRDVPRDGEAALFGRPGNFAGTNPRAWDLLTTQKVTENKMHGIIYLVGLVVVVIAILSFLGLA